MTIRKELAPTSMAATVLAVTAAGGLDGGGLHADYCCHREPAVKTGLAGPGRFPPSRQTTAPTDLS